MARIAFIGLGNMGGPMSINLVKAGHQVRGFDIVTEKTARATAGGVEAATSNPDAAKDADFVFTMLPDRQGSARSAGRYRQGDGRRRPGHDYRRFIDHRSRCDRLHSQRKPTQTRADTDRFPGLRRHGGRRGRHADLHGGRRRGCHRPRRASVFLAMGKQMVRAGGPSAGQAVKVCNNMLLGISMVGACEAIALGEAAGRRPPGPVRRDLDLDRQLLGDERQLPDARHGRHRARQPRRIRRALRRR